MEIVFLVKEEWFCCW